TAPACKAIALASLARAGSRSGKGFKSRISSSRLDVREAGVALIKARGIRTAGGALGLNAAVVNPHFSQARIALIKALRISSRAAKPYCRILWQLDIIRRRLSVFRLGIVTRKHCAKFRVVF